ncbi:unnamed protein product [Rhizoctonia solani]|uniref:Transmembrane protein n=1 Tax=Rhizoctonia solani TaxID=456999 RepID=A0A8H3HLE9_9AGAM|nr:unnamed protein product [Rhizoctonia solani]CAE6523197.1 unnamed protein product [Rhizoctonia solani]
MHFPRILSGRSQYTQHLPPWSGPLWIGAAALCLIDHIYCSTLHNQGIVRTAPSYAAATQRILALAVEFCLMASNISVIYHVSRMLASRKTRQNHSIFSYLVPIFVLLIITAINMVLTTIPLIAPSALVTVSAPSSAEIAPVLYNYSPSLIMLGFGVPISLVGLCILAGGILIWAYGPSSCGDERADLYDMAWQSPNVRVQV